MRKVILYIGMSLDGYVADRHGSVGWLQGDGSEKGHPGSYQEFIETVDSVVMGYRTYRQVISELSPGKWPYSGKKGYVLTHRRMEPVENVTFIRKNPVDFIAEMINQPGKNIWICGGASIANQLIAGDYIDRYHISVIPTILGDGIRLFGNYSAERPLQLVDTESYNGIVDLIYERRNR